MRYECGKLTKNTREMSGGGGDSVCVMMMCVVLHIIVVGWILASYVVMGHE